MRRRDQRARGAGRRTTAPAGSPGRGGRRRRSAGSGRSGRGTGARDAARPRGSARSRRSSARDRRRRSRAAAVRAVRVDDDRRRVERVAVAGVLEDRRARAPPGGPAAGCSLEPGPTWIPISGSAASTSSVATSGARYLRAPHHPARMRGPEAELAGVAPLGEAAREEAHALEPLAERRAAAPAAASARRRR